MLEKNQIAQASLILGTIEKEGVRMQAVNKLEDLSQWCLGAQVGAEADFSVADDINQERASQFANGINEQRGIGHVWLNVDGTGFVPDAVTRIHIRCSH